MDTKKGARERWEEAYSKNPERDAEFSTMSGIPIKPLYTPDDVEGSYDEKLGYPGEYSLHAASTRTCTADGCGQSGSSRASRCRGDEPAVQVPHRSRPERSSRSPSTCRP